MSHVFTCQSLRASCVLTKKESSKTVAKVFEICLVYICYPCMVSIEFPCWISNFFLEFGYITCKYISWFLLRLLKLTSRWTTFYQQTKYLNRYVQNWIDIYSSVRNVMCVKNLCMSISCHNRLIDYGKRYVLTIYIFHIY